ncbi:DNA-binding GntR family transcriptional regulator [Amorphus suaedae]
MPIMLDHNSPFSAGSTPPKPGAKRAFAEERIRDAVVHCELVPGSTVSEVRLMEVYGLNRAGVRAALLRLEGEGMVEALPRHGWRIRPVSGAYIGEVVAARRALERSFAVRTLTDPQVARIDELGQIVSVLVGRSETGSRKSHRSYDRELMETLMGGMGSLRRRWLGEVWDHCARIVHFFERGGAEPFEPADRARLIAACQARNEGAIQDELASAVDAYERYVLSAFCAQDAEIVAPARPGRTQKANRRSAEASPQKLSTKRGTDEWIGRQDS